MDKRNAGWSNARWILVGAVLAGSLWLFLSTVRHVPIPYNLPFEVFYDATDGEAGALHVVPQFELWYGNWRSVLMWTGIFTTFLLGFVLLRRRIEWRNVGLYTAFVISLCTEMFGLHESHLWALALDRLGLLALHLGVYLVMVVSMGRIAIGVSLVAAGGRWSPARSTATSGIRSTWG